MAKKGISVWIFSSLTFLALLHLVEAIAILVFKNEIRLLQLYPFVGERLQAITPTIYFMVSAVATFVLWGITCAIVFENPVETFLNKILSDAKKQGTVESQLLEQKSEVLDMMNETIESNNEILAQVRDTVFNVRVEVKGIEPLREGVEKMKTEISSLRKEVRKLEEKVRFPTICLACGKPLLPEFKICPYCGENLKLLPEKVVSVENYR